MSRGLSSFSAYAKIDTYFICEKEKGVFMQTNIEAITNGLDNVGDVVAKFSFMQVLWLLVLIVV